ncbi:hypothetical protein [Paludibacterium denitrificans]|uniref:hypothetical protein n=1 Tax=Paludibacterium denitrificans TaxID=2675226 RepID=UPI001E461B98|nr:hypothetical protein [Paludibacterium denitrificans]
MSGWSPRGLLKARRGAGFYVTGPVASTETGKPAPEQLTERAIDSGWLLRKVFEHTEGNLHARLRLAASQLAP